MGILIRILRAVVVSLPPFTEIAFSALTLWPPMKNVGVGVGVFCALLSLPPPEEDPLEPEDAVVVVIIDEVEYAV